MMTPEEVARIKNAVASEAFADDKLRVLQLAMSGLFLRCDDVTAILSGFQFGEDKLKALRLMGGYIFDRENSFEILKSFTFSGEKEEAQKILR